jgi:hypothetical protein
MDGYRLPATLLRKEHTLYAVKHLPFETRESWEAEYPRRGCPLWDNETKTGRRLLHAERREGLKDVTPVREETPAGWHRFCLGWQVERDSS